MGKIRKRIKKRIENSLNFGLMQYKQWFKHNIMRLVNILVIRSHKSGNLEITFLCLTTNKFLWGYLSRPCRIYGA